MRNRIKLISENGLFSGSKIFVNGVEIPATKIKIEGSMQTLFVVNLEFLVKDKIEIELNNVKVEK